MTSANDALSMLDEMNEQRRMEYADYSQLHDAIAFTPGRETLTAAQVKEAARGHYNLRMVRDVDGLAIPQVIFDWQAIADELNAVLRREPC